MTKAQRTSFFLNLLIVLLTIFAIWAMLADFRFMSEPSKPAVLSSANAKAFKYFTVDSNVFAGIISLVIMIVQLLIDKGKGRLKKIPKLLHLLKLAATTGVTLTMLVTAFFLAPFQYDFFSLFMDSNLFLHLVIPLVCIVTFVFFEPADISTAQTFAGTVPMLIYAIFYSTNIILHLQNGQTSHDYDWYGFLDGGVNTIWFVGPLLLAVTWAMALLIQTANNKFAHNRA
ncbi:MAG: hypothetical protein J6V73_01265 [Spirochaetaceae bacterium]|nr:hypothetical protein [Spirochaetaceae bacterium]